MVIVSWLRWFDGCLAGLERAAVVLLLTTLLGLGLLQVLGRNLFASGLFWADELLQHMVLWLGLLGASLATRAQRHLRIDVLARLLPARWQPCLVLLTDATACLVCGLLLRAAWGFIRSERTAGTVLTFGVPAWMAQSMIPLVFGTIALRFALHVLETAAQLARWDKP